MISRPRPAKSRPLSTGALLGGLILGVAWHAVNAQRPASPQRGGAPRPDTPQLLVSVLSSSDPRVGLAMADAIRQRMQSEHNATDLYVTPDQTRRDVLAVAGFNPDSVLGTTDLVALAKQVRGDYALDGTVERTSAGVRTVVRLVSKARAADHLRTARPGHRIGSRRRGQEGGP